MRATRARGPSPPPRVGAWIGVAAASVALVAVLGVWLIRRPAAPPLTERDTIVIGDFHNTTGDAVFDDTLRQGLTIQLQQSPYVTLLPDARIRRTLALMQRRLTIRSPERSFMRSASARDRPPFSRARLRHSAPVMFSA